MTTLIVKVTQRYGDRNLERFSTTDHVEFDSHDWDQDLDDDRPSVTFRDTTGFDHDIRDGVVTVFLAVSGGVVAIYDLEAIKQQDQGGEQPALVTDPANPSEEPAPLH